MSNFPISGKPIPEIDLREISIGELDDMRDPRQPAKDAYALLAKITGLTVAEIRALKVHDCRALVQEVYIKSWGPPPESEKNLPSAST